MKKKPEVPFEDSLNDDWSHDLNMVEVPLGSRPLIVLGAVIACVAFIVLGRVAYLNWSGGAYYAARAEDNADQAQATPAPRGIIYDAEGDPLVLNKAVFDAVLDANLFISDPSMQSSTLAAAQSILGIPSSTVWSLLAQNETQDFSTPIVLTQDLDQSELVNLQALGSSTIEVESDFERYYPNGPVFSSVVGYVGRVSESDLAKNPELTANDFVGKDGIEEEYDTVLQGTPGVDVKFTDAQGRVLGETQESAPAIGSSVHLTIDGGLQTYLYNRIAQELVTLNRQVGIGLVINPQTGAVLSLVNLPGFDNNAFTNPASSTAEIEGYLTSPDKPLFDRIVSGQYQPGSTIKPLDGVAALKEGVITPDRELFSPGYLMVPDPYNSSTPTRYADWEPHGYIDLASALAQSSDVYFYIVGGGSPEYTTPPLNNPVDYGIQGLGPNELFNWWTTFGLGKKTGIDLPNEAAGFLPTPAWWSTISTRPWSLGDTYNVSIGQGSLALTPIQLLSYIDAIANGGTIYQPFLNASSTPHVNEDLTSLLPEIQEVQQGMLEAVTSPQGTAYTMDGLPAQACAKTGSAQVQNNQEENALFVGYFPCDNPQIALLILIENSKQGSLNAVPIAKDVFNWYYENRMTSSK
ncbi:MAG TPA: penicillin-binding transpeptidase domain-containing protein [Candidatus Paceibacterota bacterium]|nr:penicillin-binding transpeptidase domain-containing protein [Candidatus Paceibacterota bacterium]